ncbi:hypothetical protein ACFL0O_08905 [Thermodesulfobacteriota bacterium]
MTMPEKKNMASLIRENRTLLIIIAIAFLLVEIEIFTLASMKSGRKSRLQVIDHNGSVIHETDGNKLSDFNRYYFEKTFGPFEQYEVKLATREVPFPFRAWFSAAVGIPVGAILLFAFIVKAYTALFYEEEIADTPGSQPSDHETRLEKIIATVGRFNVFTIGFLIFLAVFAYWVVPNLIVYSANVGIETLTRYKWIFLTIGILLFFVVLWIIYLRYLLVKTKIDKMFEVEKYRLQLEMNSSGKLPPELEYHDTEVQEGTFEVLDDDKKTGENED